MLNSVLRICLALHFFAVTRLNAARKVYFWQNDLLKCLRYGIDRIARNYLNIPDSAATEEPYSVL